MKVTNKIINFPARNHLRGSVIKVDPLLEATHLSPHTHKYGYDIINVGEQEIAATMSEDKGGNSMDITKKEYIDNRINSLEKSMNQKFESQQVLFTEKLDHMQTRTEKTIGEKFSVFKDEMDKNRKDDRKFYVKTAISSALVIVGVLGFIL